MSAEWSDDDDDDDESDDRSIDVKVKYVFGDLTFVCFPFHICFIAPHYGNDDGFRQGVIKTCARRPTSWRCVLVVFHVRCTFHACGHNPMNTLMLIGYNI